MCERMCAWDQNVNFIKIKSKKKEKKREKWGGGENARDKEKI